MGKNDGRPQKNTVSVQGVACGGGKETRNWACSYLGRGGGRQGKTRLGVKEDHKVRSQFFTAAEDLSLHSKELDHSEEVQH
jgi:hypothetical protein